ncbi:laccase-15 isoform X2 [Elaeis guineensis]|uniref:laccase-15 isoform X2 n=1 Tax=Elaeis guineensis var. tenera TaxID=51953 RepID=UPI003C6CE4DB
MHAFLIYVGWTKKSILWCHLQSFGKINILAEDLGVITEDVVQLRKAIGAPGMAVLHFWKWLRQSHLPRNHEQDQVVYTGTHDNDTILGWWEKIWRRKRSVMHGVRLPRNPWSDGPEYVTQCPIQPGSSFIYTVTFTDEEGTLWWHAHSDYSRATVHGAIVIYPRRGTSYPFPKPSGEVILILGEWWKRDVSAVLETARETGADPTPSDAFTINGQPGDLYPCSKPGTFRMLVEPGKTYLLRMVNAAMEDALFVSIAGHLLTLVGSDASYTKPLTSDYILISPGETMDFLLTANQSPRNLYYMAARALSYEPVNNFDTTTTTAIVQYKSQYTSWSTNPLLPSLPFYNDTEAASKFAFSIRSLASTNWPINVPKRFDQRMVITVSVNEFECPPGSCQGPNGTRLASSLNNMSFVNPSIDILEAYYKGINGAFDTNFPSRPLYYFNFTAEYQPFALLKSRLATEVRILEYGTTVEMVFQGTSLVTAENHPMHLHGQSFYVVGWGFGNFNEEKDPLGYNLEDPPLKNTFGVPTNGWLAVRFTAYNPGVWFLHCHLERHLISGMDTVFIVKNGVDPGEKLLPPPPHMPPC